MARRRKFTERPDTSTQVLSGLIAAAIMIIVVCLVIWLLPE